MKQRTMAGGLQARFFQQGHRLAKEVETASIDSMKKESTPNSQLNFVCCLSVKTLMPFAVTATG
jgi:hypothetical protein